MGTFRIILPALITLVFSLALIWIVASYVKKYIGEINGENSDGTKISKSVVNKTAWFVTAMSLFFSIWWLVALLSVNEIPRSVIDRTLNTKMRDNFEDRMVADTTKKK